MHGTLFAAGAGAGVGATCHESTSHTSCESGSMRFRKVLPRLQSRLSEQARDMACSDVALSDVVLNDSAFGAAPSAHLPSAHLVLAHERLRRALFAFGPDRPWRALFGEQTTVERTGLHVSPAAWTPRVGAPSAAPSAVPPASASKGAPSEGGPSEASGVAVRFAIPRSAHAPEVLARALGVTVASQQPSSRLAALFGQRSTADAMASATYSLRGRTHITRVEDSVARVAIELTIDVPTGAAALTAYAADGTLPHDLARRIARAYAVAHTLPTPTPTPAGVAFSGSLGGDA